VFLVTGGTSQSRINCGYNDFPQAADLNKALAQASSIPVGPDRDAAYQKIQKTALDLAVVVPLYYGTRNILVNPRLQGTVMDANSIIHFATITLAQ
jgi:ABC-type transport system substrate-binding protein